MLNKECKCNKSYNSNLEVCGHCKCVFCIVCNTNWSWSAYYDPGWACPECTYKMKFNNVITFGESWTLPLVKMQAGFHPAQKGVFNVYKNINSYDYRWQCGRFGGPISICINGEILPERVINSICELEETAPNKIIIREIILRSKNYPKNDITLFALKLRDDYLLSNKYEQHSVCHKDRPRDLMTIRQPGRSNIF